MMKQSAFQAKAFMMMLNVVLKAVQLLHPKRTDSTSKSNSDTDWQPTFRWTTAKAVPFHAWAGIQLGHLVDCIPVLFPKLADWFTVKKHTFIRTFFLNLGDNDIDFAGFHLPEDLIQDIIKCNFLPQLWHLGPSGNGVLDQ